MIITNKDKIKSFVEDFNENNIQQSGYDLTIGADYELQNKVEAHVVHGEKFVVPPKSFLKIYTKERINLPDNVSAMLTLRSKYSRNAIFMNSAKINPGFKGKILLELFSSEYSTNLYLCPGEDKLVHVTFFEHEHCLPYDGIYQNQDKQI